MCRYRSGIIFAHTFDFASAEFDRHIKLLEKKLEVVVEVEVEDEDKDVLPDCVLGENPDFIAASNALELK